jgi:RNA polymerase sigma-70 factor (ECF subfamily)
MTIASETDIDIALVAAARAGDQAAFARLVERHGPRLYQYAYRRLGRDAEAAADVVQDSLVSAYRALARLDLARPDTCIAAWLYRIVDNRCLDLLRHRQCHRQRAFDPARDEAALATGRGASADDPERVLLGAETAGQVRAALARLRPRHRQALLLRECQELSCEQIGQRLGMSRTAVKSMLFRARAELRRAYAEVERRPAAPGDRERRRARETAA